MPMFAAGCHSVRHPSVEVPCVACAPRPSRGARFQGRRPANQGESPPPFQQIYSARRSSMNTGDPVRMPPECHWCIAEPAVPIVVYQCRRGRLFGDVAPLQARHPVLQLPDQPGSTDR
jgi:hypothetical protein